MDPRRNTYTIQEVAYLLGTDDRRIVFLLSGPVPLANNDCYTVGSGNRRKLSYATVVRLAIVNAVTDLGVGPTAAARYAAVFCNQPSVGRAAGSLFSVDKTFLVGSARSGARVLNIPIETPTDQLLELVPGHSHRALVLNLNTIITDLNKNLDAMRSNEQAIAA